MFAAKKLTEIQKFMETQERSKREAMDLTGVDKQFIDGTHYRQEVAGIDIVHMRTIVREAAERRGPLLKLSDPGSKNLASPVVG